MKLLAFPAIALVSVAPLLSADTPAFVLPPETATLKPGPGADLATSRCVMCHSVDYIATQPRLTAAQWKAAVVKMQEKFGAPIAAGDVDGLVEYLAKNYGTETK